MSFSLRKQLLVVSLLTLALPVAGYQYIREMESALRVDHETALADGALAVARVVADRWPEREEPIEGDTMFAHRLDSALAMDGYVDDWGQARGLALDHETNLGKSDSLHVRSLLGHDSVYLYLFIEVFDDYVTWWDPGRGPVHDRLLVRWTRPDGRIETRLVQTAAPGPVGGDRGDLLGEWQPNANGYQIELRVQRRLVDESFGFVVIDGDGVPMDPPLHAGTMPIDGDSVGLLREERPALGELVEDFVDPGERWQIADRFGWVLASSGSLDGRDGDGARDSLLTRIYRWILDPKLTERRRVDTAGRVFGPDITDARSGRQGTVWYRAPDRPGAVVAASAPIVLDDRIVGTVTLEQQSAAILTLTRSALTRLVNLTVMATATAAFGLLGFATWLSFRIRRLRNAAEGALKSDGQIRASIPGVDARDEIGDLSRSFADLLEQLREYTDYLRSLAGKLSHELRTPLAVVRSSLDNLANESMSDEAQVYAERARDGTQRLTRILTAMSEATRVEESIDSAERERFDLRAVLDGATSGYRDTYPARNIVFAGPPGPHPFMGVPELLVQMLDKLIENAVDFTPADGEIRISLSRQAEHYHVSVANDGPLLPPAMQGGLFDSMVSVRRGHTEQSHLGLGLFIARLITQFHGGDIRGENRADGKGVVFKITLPARENHA
ncbi:MAG: ATP-binding protein [Pseudomonadota bacterium]